MNNFLNRFYFLSKLATSLILLILLILLSYLFIKAYLDQKNSSSSDIEIKQFSNQIANLANIVEHNSNNLNVIKNLAQNNEKSVQEISLNLKNTHDNKINNNLLLQIKKLFEENKKLKTELSNISLTINNLENFQPLFSQDDRQSSVENIIKLIRLKLDNGSSFNEEVELLRDLDLSPEYLSHVEKLSIYETEKFPGLDRLNNNFDEIASNYLNDYYLKKNNSYFIKNFFNLVLIQPNLSENIEDETVLLLSLAKQNLLEKNVNESIIKLNELNDGEYFFSKWVKQAKYYVQVTSLLNKF